MTAAGKENNFASLTSKCKDMISSLNQPYKILVLIVVHKIWYTSLTIQ